MSASTSAAAALHDATPAPALAAEGVSVRYGTVTVLDEVSLDVSAGACVALVGESGAGKTTLLRCFNALVVPDAGRVLVDGSDVRALDAVALRRRTGYVPQDGGLLPHWTVRRNVALVPTLLGATDADARARADAALALVALDPGRFGGRYPHELSGGQRQRTAVARALAGGAGLVLLDEPFGALDAITRADAQATFARVRTERAAAGAPITAVLVTHDLREAERLADVTAVLRAGRVEQVAPFAELVAGPATPCVRTSSSGRGCDRCAERGVTIHRPRRGGGHAAGVCRRSWWRARSCWRGVGGGRARGGGQPWQARSWMPLRPTPRSRRHARWSSRASRSARATCWPSCSPSCSNRAGTGSCGAPGSVQRRWRSVRCAPGPSTSTPSTRGRCS